MPSLEVIWDTLQSRSVKDESVLGEISGKLVISYDNTNGGNLFLALATKFKKLRATFIEPALNGGVWYELFYDHSSEKIQIRKQSDGSEPADDTAFTTYFYARGIK